MSTPAYDILGELSTNEWSALVRARRRSDGRSVLLRMPRGATARAADLLEHNLRILERIDDPGVIRAEGMARVEGADGLVLEDRGGEPLRPPGRVDLDSFFPLAIRLAAILGELHRRDIVHRNLTPSAILVQPESGEVTLCDFAMASGGPAEIGASHPVPPRASYPYLSPEQTGRMNRTTDYRTDFYSLGAILYEQLTGSPPFTSADGLELIHSHIARMPRAPAEIEPAIPAAVSDLVLKLLAKTAEGRYRSALGLREDLVRCSREWSARRSIDPFPLGRHDVSDRFMLPEKLYGRERELETLARGFDRACEGAASLMLVTGYAGIGKTSLIQELYRPIARQRGTFVSGKFDQVVRDIPFGAVIQAFRGLVQQLLTLGEERLDAIRAQLADALGANAGVLTEVIPEIGLIVGDQPLPAPLGALESQNRFRLVIQNFLGVVCRKEHPLVLFLDDLQWADAASLGLLETLLLSDESRHLFLIGAYRDNEVEEGHPLSRALAGLEADGARVERIRLGPLAAGDVRALVRDTLNGEPSDVDPLADIVVRKTDGNPFFVTQFLKALHHESLLTFDYGLGRWTFDLEAIASTAMTDNVIDLMTSKIRRLSSAAQRALTLAACIGGVFDIDTLGTVSEQPPAAAYEELREALSEGLVVPVSRPLDSPAETTVAEGTPAFAFLHDRVQQAAYALIPEDRRRTIHLAVGRLLLGRRDSSVADQGLFDVVHHLNLGRDLIHDPAERVHLARLNLAAGRKAKNATAYQAALGYLHAGLALLPSDAWSAQPDLAFELNFEAAECEYLGGEFERAEERFELLLSKSRNRLERAQVLNLWVLQYENTSRYADAVRRGREALALFGVTLPEGEGGKESALASELATIREALGGRSIASLVDLPLMTDPEMRMVMKLLTTVWAPAYVAGDLPLTRVISALLVRLSLQHGNTEESAYGYVTHGITIGPVQGDYESGQAFGELALALNDRLGDTRHRAKVHHMFSCFVNVWRRPMETCIPHAREALRSGLETGDFAYANYGVFHQSWYGLLTSRSLARYLAEYEPNVAVLTRIKMTSFAECQKVILGWARALRGETEEPASLSGKDFDAEGYVAKYGADPFFMTFYRVIALHLRVLFEREDEALRGAQEARAVVDALRGTLWPVLLDFLTGLALTAVHDRAPEAERAARLEALGAISGRLDTLAANCPENFLCWATLVRAEIARVTGREQDAIKGYEAALGSARRAGRLANEALTQERFARFWRERGNTVLAAACLSEARGCYREWGATAKVRDLEDRYAVLLPALQATPAQSSAAPDTRADALDLGTVAKAAHAIAVEIRLEDLLRKLVAIAIENAGAQRGVFLRERDEALVIEAAGSVEDPEVSVLRSAALDDDAPLSRAVVNYVHKTRESVILTDASGDERFASDPYLAAAGPLSILCVPVVHQGRFEGILYLENRLASGAFTADRIKIVNMLSSQAAISLENARLYGEMEEEVGRRRRAEEGLRVALSEVEALKNRLQAENVYLQEEIRREHNFEEIVGTSPALLSLLRDVDQVAPTDSTVLVCGETGTGKELVARAIHNRSARRGRPLVKVNCAAMSAGLVESELFGHVKGAFTGALERRQGRFELADGGTLFLDEVGELALETQAKLLRVLQEQEFEPVGSNRTVRVDVRIIAATNRDLEKDVASGRFRPDLFYRLNVLPIRVPPLRDRASDIPQLAMFLLSRFNKKFGKRVEGVARETMDLLARYPWPGNIRELQNLIERAVVLSQGPVLALDGDLLRPITGIAGRESERVARPDPAAAGTIVPRPLDAAGRGDSSSLEEIERRHIVAILRQTGGVIEGPSGAARILDLHPNTLRSRMKKLGISRKSHEIS